MKLTILKFINPILFVLFFVAVVAMVLYRLTGGSEFYREMHIFAGTLFIIMGVLHLIYNWGWVRTNFFKKKKKHK